MFYSSVIQDFKEEGNETKKNIIVDIEKLSSRDIEYIKNNIIQISDGRKSLYDTKDIALYIQDVLRTKSEEQRHGAIAEFILTCILRNKEFSQEHCFINLEDRGAKKGFDGLFYYDNDYWITESKAAFKQTAHNNKHKTTIDRAYKSLSEQLAGKVTSNAWQNAYQHTRISGSKKSLTKKMWELSKDYVNNEYSLIEENSVVLGSSIINEDINSIENNSVAIEEYIKEHRAKNELVVIITMKSIDMVLEIIEELANE